MGTRLVAGWFLLAACFASWSPLASGQNGQAELRVSDLALSAPPVRVTPMTWQGRSAVMALVPRQPALAEDSDLDLVLAGLNGEALKKLTSLPLPAGMRWLEPLQLAGTGETKNRTRWLGLIGSTWMLGRHEGNGGLAWRALCDCPTLFSAGRGRLPANARFAHDLDGDGRSEILLPDWNGLLIYALETSAAGAKLRLIRRVHWDIKERYQVKEDRLSVRLNVPRYVLLDANRDGVLDFVSISNEGIAVARLKKPTPAPPGPYYSIHGGLLPLLRQSRLPPAALTGLERLGAASFRGRGAFLAALTKAAGEPLGLPRAQEQVLLTQLEGPVPVDFPSASPIGNGKPASNKESHRIHTVADMDGDGALDVIHVKSTDTGGLLGQKNRLRWFPGNPVGGGGLTFSNQNPQVFFSEGPAFAELIWPSTDRKAPPAMFLATTEVSLLAVVRAFTLNTVLLSLFVYPWEGGKLVVPPPIQGNLTFELKKKDKKNRPMILLADLNGDGWREYLFNMETDSLTAYRGARGGPRLNGGPMASKKIALPHRPETIFVTDLDGDKREELVLWFSRKENPVPLRKTLRVISYGRK